VLLPQETVPESDEHQHLGSADVELLICQSGHLDRSDSPENWAEGGENHNVPSHKVNIELVGEYL